MLHPAKDNKVSVVRFTAPADGQYAVSATYRNLDAQAKSTRPVLVVSGVVVIEKYQNGPNTKTTYAKTFLLRKGDPVDFGVDNAGDRADTFKDDAVELTLKIDRAPGSPTPQLSGGPEGALTDLYATTTGEIRLILAFVDFSDAIGGEQTDFAAIWDKIGSNGALAETFEKQSAGKAKLKVTPVATWRRMPQPLSYYFPPDGSPWKWPEYIDNAANLYNDQRPVTNGTVMVVVPPQDAAGFTTVSGAHGFGNSVGWWGMRRIITLAPAIYTEHYTTLAHELGHTFGLGELYPATEPYKHEVAGYDFMGDVVYATGFIGWHRHKFLWMDDARKAFLPTQGNYIVPLRRLSDTAGVNMVVVPDKGASATKPAKVWVIEINQDVIARQDYLAGNGKKLVSAGDGILIYTVETPAQAGKRELRLVQPGLDKNWKNLQVGHLPALYKAGAVFDQAQSPIKVTVWGKSETGFVLEIIVRTTAKP